MKSSIKVENSRQARLRTGDVLPKMTWSSTGSNASTLAGDRSDGDGPTNCASVTGSRNREPMRTQPRSRMPEPERSKLWVDVARSTCARSSAEDSDSAWLGDCTGEVGPKVA